METGTQQQNTNNSGASVIKSILGGIGSIFKYNPVAGTGMFGPNYSNIIGPNYSTLSSNSSNVETLKNTLNTTLGQYQVPFANQSPFGQGVNTQTGGGFSYAQPQLSPTQEPIQTPQIQPQQQIQPQIQPQTTTAVQQPASKVQQYQPTQEGLNYINNLNQYTQQIQGLYSRVDDNYNRELSQINAQMGRLMSQQQAENEAYTAGVRQLGITSGMSVFTPEIMQSNIKQSIDSGIQKLTDITMQQNSLILEADKANVSQKLEIVGKLKELDTEKYNVARQMKEDFYTNLKRKQEQEELAANKTILSNYDYLRNLTPQERQVKLIEMAQNSGVPVSEMMSYFANYDKEEKKQVVELRGELLSKLGIPADYDILNSSPSEFQNYLESNPVYREYQRSFSLDNALKSAQLNKLNQESSFMDESGLSEGLMDAYYTIKGNPNIAKHSKEDLSNTMNNPNISYGAKKTTLLNAAREMTQDPKTTESYEKLLTKLPEFAERMNKFYEIGDKTNIFTGTEQQIKRKLGTQKNSELTILGTEILEDMLRFRKDITGVAFGKLEAQDMWSLFPKLTNTQAVNTAIMEARLNTIKRELKSQYNTILPTGAIDEFFDGLGSGSTYKGYNL